VEARSVPAEKIVVIPNGVQLETFNFSPPPPLSDDEPIRLLYFGTLSAWQGLELAVRALALAARETSVHLTLIGPATQSQVEALRGLAEKLGVGDLITILTAVSQDQLARYAHQSHAILAPLSPNDRNLEQGCCPLKILEGMATGTPVIASELPVVKEIAGDDCVIYAKSNSANSWKDRIVELRTLSHARFQIQSLSQDSLQFASPSSLQYSNPSLVSRQSNAQMAFAARDRIERLYTWERAQHRLSESYLRLLERAPQCVRTKQHS
jgi:glycosyltransferase involved in cell wall biosynthesis